MELRDALAQISEIRLRMARAEVFRGYKAAPTALSGLFAFAAAELQAALVPDATHNPAAYLGVWVGAAVLSAMIAGGTIWVHYRRWAPLQRQTGWLVAEQFLPSMVAGGILTFAMLRFAPDSLWLLPGLWQILFSLGLFASLRQLPRAMVGVAVFYLLTGVLCIALTNGDRALTPLAMGIPFGVGQLLAAAVLYWTLERVDG